MGDLPTMEMLHRLLVCDAEAGKLFWRARTPDLFGSVGHDAIHNCRKWNARYAGREAFVTLVKGYLVGSIFGQRLNAHQIIFAMTDGRWPADFLDHIDGDRSNNSRANLREVDHLQNCRNAKMPVTNTTGAVGLEWVARVGRWRARIQVDGRTIHLGYFAEREAAIQARAEADVHFGFHPNHGRAA
jgi:hypothetical protein